jgi:hypothetical protein
MFSEMPLNEERKSMKRVNPKEFPEKFRKHGVKPKLTAYLIVRDDGPCEACALAMEAIDFSGLVPVIDAYTNRRSTIDLRVEPRPSDRLVRLSGLNASYARGLDDGWTDNANQENDGSVEYLKGKRDGVAAHGACVEAFGEF